MHEYLSDFDLPWCRDLITSEDFVLLDTSDRRRLTPSNKDVTNTLFKETLNTEKTIRAMIVLQGRSKKPGFDSPEYIALLSLGTGLDGYKGLVHGGFSALVMDQVAGVCASRTFGVIVTVESWQKFKRSIKVPSIILCRTFCTKVVGRRIFLEITIEDGMGTVYCEGGFVGMMRDKSVPAKL